MDFFLVFVVIYENLLRSDHLTKFHAPDNVEKMFHEEKLHFFTQSNSTNIRKNYIS